jgi:hypothetical protein
MPLICVILFLFISAIAALVANMKGRGWKLFLKMNGAAIVIDVFMMIVFPDLESRRLGVTLVILAGGVVALGLVICSPNSMQIAVRDGQYGEYKRCPFCAEPVRKEAVKCKHGHSQLTATPADCKEQ